MSLSSSRSRVKCALQIPRRYYHASNVFFAAHKRRPLTRYCAAAADGQARVKTELIQHFALTVWYTRRRTPAVNAGTTGTACLRAYGLLNLNRGRYSFWRGKNSGVEYCHDLSFYSRPAFHCIRHRSIFGGRNLHQISAV
jgi:hypothetical protein